MVPIKETILNIGLKARASLTKATVIIVVQIIHQRNVQCTVKHVIHATKGALQAVLQMQTMKPKSKWKMEVSLKPKTVQTWST